MVERNAWANDDYNPWYLEASPFGDRIVSPTFLASFDVSVFYGYYSYPAEGSLFAKQEFEFLKPVFAGRTYQMSGRILDIYRRKGRTFFKVGILIADLDGVHMVRMVKTVAAPVTPKND
jgi:acyl dehydratase